MQLPGLSHHQASTCFRKGTTDMDSDDVSAVALAPDDLSREHLLEHIADLNRRVRNQRKEIRQLRRAQTFDRLSVVAERVVEAAKWAVFCPNAGGYHGGRSVEDCYEELAEAVNAYFGTDIESPAVQWWSEEELDAAIAKQRVEG